MPRPRPVKTGQKMLKRKLYGVYKYFKTTSNIKQWISLNPYVEALSLDARSLTFGLWILSWQEAGNFILGFELHLFVVPKALRLWASCRIQKTYEFEKCVKKIFWKKIWNTQIILNIKSFRQNGVKSKDSCLFALEISHVLESFYSYYSSIL